MLPTECWRLDFDGRSPIYSQICEHFLRALVKGELTAGARIPSIRDLAVALKVNTNTVQRAYQEMERDKIIFSQRGTGYFIVDDEKVVAQVKEKMVSTAVRVFLEEMRALGFTGAQALSELERNINKEASSNGADDSKRTL